ncbi:hypothetical protein [Pilimelia anulata]|nr:hypothetical protein [Pilimelia anulata]
MNDQANRVAEIRFESGVGSAVQRHLAVRIERVVGMMLPSHAGQSVEQITADMQVKLRGLGVNISARQLEGYARVISNLPPIATAS